MKKTISVSIDEYLLEDLRLEWEEIRKNYRDPRAKSFSHYLETLLVNWKS